jgi:hypothetical protein
MDDRAPEVAAELGQVLVELRDYAGQRRTRQALGLLGPSLGGELLDRLEAALEHAAELLGEVQRAA